MKHYIHLFACTNLYKVELYIVFCIRHTAVTQGSRMWKHTFLPIAQKSYALFTSFVCLPYCPKHYSETQYRRVGCSGRRHMLSSLCKIGKKYQAGGIFLFHLY